MPSPCPARRPLDSRCCRPQCSSGQHSVGKLFFDPPKLPWTWTGPHPSGGHPLATRCLCGLLPVGDDMSSPRTETRATLGASQALGTWPAWGTWPCGRMAGMGAWPVWALSRRGHVAGMGAWPAWGAWPAAAGVRVPLHGAAQEPEGQDWLSHRPLLGWYRVRSIIMLQEKAQDRERLLLKFIKIMKVAAAPLGACPSRPCPGKWEAPGRPPCPHGHLASLCSIYGSSTTSTPTWPSSRRWTRRPSAGWSGRSRPQR